MFIVQIHDINVTSYVYILVTNNPKKKLPMNKLILTKALLLSFYLMLCLTSHSQTINISGKKSICLGESTTLTATGGSSYKWSTGDTSNVISVTPTTLTLYTVTATIGGNSNQATIVIFVNLPPNPKSDTNKTICIGNSIDLYANDGLTYLWNTGATTYTLTVKPTATTTYTVTTTNTCGSVSDKIVVNVSNNIAPTVDAGPDVSICQNESVILKAISSVSSYKWNNDNGSTTSTIQVTPSYSTRYKVTVTASNGCTETDKVEVTVNSAPYISTNYSQRTCVGKPIDLKVNTYGSTTNMIFNWSNGKTGQTISVSPSIETTYSVTATENGCTASSSTIVNVQNKLPVVSAGSDKYFCKGNQPINLVATGADTYTCCDTYQWSTNSTSISPSVTTAYTVTIPL